MIKRIFSPFVLAARILSFAWKILPVLVLLGTGVMVWARLTKRQKKHSRRPATQKTQGFATAAPPEEDPAAGESTPFPSGLGAPTAEAAGNWERDAGAL